MSKWVNVKKKIDEIKNSADLRLKCEGSKDLNALQFLCFEERRTGNKGKNSTC